jgi:hypothetical protein
MPTFSQISSSRTVPASMAMSDTSRNAAENVPRLILLAMLASDSFMPCFFSRSVHAPQTRRYQPPDHQGGEMSV